MFCHVCGTKISDEAKFCHKCGTKVVYEDSTDAQEKLSFSNDESTEEAEEKFNAILSKVGLDKVHTVKAVKEWTDIGVEEAEELFGKVPVLLKKDVTLKEAMEIKSVFARERAEITFTDSKGRSVDIDQYSGRNEEKTWKEKLFGDKFPNLPVLWRRIIVIAFLAGCGFFIIFGFLVLKSLLGWIFSSFIHVMIAVAGGYILYHKCIAEIITELIYKRQSKVLQLPQGMSVSMLMESLSGKFNYPYFKGVYYGENGECVIEGNYSMYPVTFKKYNYIVLEYIPRKNDKMKRTVLLEAMAIRDYINKFFNPKLPMNVVYDMKRLKLAEGQRKAVAIVCAAATVLIAVSIVWDYISPGSLQSMMVPGIEVRGAYLSQYSSNVTIEEAFENYFEDGKWSKYDSEGYTYVVFTGSCWYFDERDDIRIVFKITGKNFIVDRLDINGVAQNNLIVRSLLSEVYEDY